MEALISHYFRPVIRDYNPLTPRLWNFGLRKSWHNTVAVHNVGILKSGRSYKVEGPTKWELLQNINF